MNEPTFTDASQNDVGLQVDELKRAFASLSQEAKPRKDCPNPEELWDAACGEKSPPEVRALIDHVSGCASCAEDWRLAHEINREEHPRAVEAEPEITSAQPNRSSWIWGLPAAAILILALAVYWMQPDQGAVPHTDPIYRSQEVVSIQSLLTEGESLTLQNPRLRWTPIDGATRYHLLVSNAKFEVLYEARDLASTEAKIPPEALAGLSPGDEIYWLVEAEPTDGTEVSSPTFVTRLE